MVKASNIFWQYAVRSPYLVYRNKPCSSPIIESSLLVALVQQHPDLLNKT